MITNGFDKSLGSDELKIMYNDMLEDGMMVTMKRLEIACKARRKFTHRL